MESYREFKKNSHPGLVQLLEVLSQHVEYDCSTYKANSILRCLENRVKMLQLNKLNDYLDFIAENPHELKIFQENHLIGVTSFFRDSDAFYFLKNDVIPLLLQKKTAEETLRIWIPACSTGEEVYSIAMLVQECRRELNHYPNVKIFATDINESSLKKASDGFYPQAIKNQIPLDYLKKYFMKTTDAYKISDEIRRMIIFGKQNMINDPPFTKMDFISCRNFLIYMNEEAQQKIYSMLHFSLLDDGILFLGTSETIVKKDLFKNLSMRWKLYRKNKISSYLEAALNFPTPYRARHFIPLVPIS